MSGYNFSYKVYKKYLVDIFEYYEDTNFTRAFIYKKNSVGKDLIEIMDFPSETEKSFILERAGDFIKELEKLVTPVKAVRGRKKGSGKSVEKSMNDL